MSTAQRLAGQTVLVIFPNTDRCRKVYPTGVVEIDCGTECVQFTDSPAGGELKSLPAARFDFVI